MTKEALMEMSDMFRTMAEKLSAEEKPAEVNLGNVLEFMDKCSEEQFVQIAKKVLGTAEQHNVLKQVIGDYLYEDVIKTILESNASRYGYVSQHEIDFDYVHKDEIDGAMLDDLGKLETIFDEYAEQYGYVYNGDESYICKDDIDVEFIKDIGLSDDVLTDEMDNLDREQKGEWIKKLLDDLI